MKQKTHLFFKYQKQYNKNPKSLVFVPYAEFYRQMGLVDQAISLLKEGLTHRPNYYLAFIILGRCFYDKGEFQTSYKILLPLVDQYPDNKILQMIYAQTCEQLGKFDQALNSYKMLLFYTPKENWLKRKVFQLEDIGNSSPTLSSPELVSDLSKAEVSPVEYWQEKMMVDNIVPFERKIVEKEETSPLLTIATPVMTSPPFSEFPENKLEITEKDEVSDSSHFHSLTLVSLLEWQGHFDKAVQVLEKMIELKGPEKSLIEKRHTLIQKMVVHRIPVGDQHPENDQPQQDVQIVLDQFLREIQEKCLSKNPLTNRILQRLKS
jgi:tetratricopeptide (TPR) repeat protein